MKIRPQTCSMRRRQRGFIIDPFRGTVGGGGGGCDPFYDLTILRLHCDGSGSVGTGNLTDTSFAGGASASVTGTNYDTTNKHSGSASLLFASVTGIGFSGIPAIGTNEFLVRFWLRTGGDISTAQVVFDQRPTSTNGAYLSLYIDSGEFAFYANTGAHQITTTGGALSTNHGYWIELSRASDNKTRLFMDGTQIGSALTDTTNYAATGLTIGRNGFTFANFFGGNMDEISMYAGAGVGITSSAGDPGVAADDVQC